MNVPRRFYGLIAILLSFIIFTTASWSSAMGTNVQAQVAAPRPQADNPHFPPVVFGENAGQLKASTPVSDFMPGNPDATRGDAPMRTPVIPDDVYDARFDVAENMLPEDLTLLAPRSNVSDSKGTDFWLAFSFNYDGASSLRLFITSDVNTSGRVEIPGLHFSTAFNVTADSVTTVNLPANADITTSNRVESKGIHVTAVDEVTIYGLNQERWTTDAYLGLPTDILGEEYFNLTYSSPGTLFTIVAPQHGTTVTIIPSATVGGRKAGSPYSISLQQGQVYQLIAESSSSVDLSGSLITANKPIAVFGGHRCTNIPNEYQYCDHLVEQLFPTDTWGENFVTMPLATRRNGDTFRIVASEDNTRLRINGIAVTTLQRGQFHRAIISGPAQITANNPILVAQYSNSTTYDGVTSDPFMMLVPPYEQFLANYTVTTPASGINSNYINVVAPNAAVGHITLDGATIPASRFMAIGSSGFSGAQIAVNLGSHSLSGSHPFGVFVYGFDYYDSYGYPGGLSLAQVATVAHLTLEPQHATNRINTEHCVTATATDQFGNPVKDVRIDFEVDGVHNTTGFSFTNDEGEARFCYTGVNWGDDTITASTGDLSATATKTWGFSPSGYLGRAECDAISGWAGDKDDPNQPIDVHIYADDSWPDGTFISAVTADEIRETAVCEALGGSNCGVCSADEPQCKHGFVFTNIPAWVKDGQPHDIYVYGINLPGTGGSGSVLLGGVPKTLQCQPTPTSTFTPTATPDITATPTPTFTPTATLHPDQLTPTPPLPTPTATPDFPVCSITVDKTAYPSTASINGQVGVTLKLEGDCPSEVGSAVDVAMVIDRSSSMCGAKLDQAQAAGELFFDNMAFPPDQAAVISFANTALMHTGLTGNRTQAQNALYNITCGGFSRIDAGLSKAYEEMSGPRRVAGHTPAIILLTDGKPEGAYADDVRAAAQQINEAGIQLFAIGLGDDVNAALLRDIASQPDYYYQSPTPEQLALIYTRLAGDLRNVPGMNVHIIDVVGPDFEIVPHSFTGAATPQVNGDTLIWQIPRLDDGVTEVSFRVRPKACGTFPVNQSATVSYDDNRGVRQIRAFPVPAVTIEGCDPDEPDPEVFVRDNEFDHGQVPSDKPWWVSPDIWVRHNDDGGMQHQNPQAGQRNYIQVRIWNESDETVRDIDVQMYFAIPSLGLSWPDNWSPIAVSGHVDAIAPHSSTIVSIPWDVPNIVGHFCLFVRISSPQDPIRDDRVQWENNIAQRNMHIIDYPQPQEGSCKFEENNLLTDRIAFDVVNTLATSSMVDLRITLSDRGSNTEIRLDPGALAGRWTSLDGLDPEDDGRLHVTDYPATVYGVRLNPHEQRTVYLEVKAPANSRFVVGISEIVRGKVVGGNSYQRTLPPCPLTLPMILASAGQPTPTPTPCPPDKYTPPDVMLVIDRSGSMGGPKLAAAKDAVGVFLDEMDLTKEKAGIVSFSASATLDQQLTQDRNALDSALASIAAAGGTAIGVGIQVAHAELQSVRHDPTHVPAMILLSDGQSGDDPIPSADAAKAAGIRIVAIGLGSDADEDTLRKIASDADDYYFAPAPDDLIAIYQAIAGSIHCGP